jgi:glycosyltransferase involved in cell wall biosynthesis
MKVVIDAYSARIGGGRTYLVQLLERLPADSGIEALVYAPDDLVLPERRNLRRGRTGWPVRNPVARAAWQRLALPRVLAAERADVLFCPGGVVATPVPAGCRTVTMFRNMIPFDRRARSAVPMGLQRLRNRILHRVMLRSFATADLTIFISDYARGVIESIGSVRRAVTIPHGIDRAFRTAGTEPPRPAWLPDGEYLLYVSRFDVYKHHHEVVTGYARLPAALRQRFALVLAGECDTPQAARVRSAAAALGVSDRVSFAGPIPYRELPAVYRHAAANLFASSCENCPNILLEALAAGRPVLSSDVMPMPEFGGDAVRYFSPFDPDDISNAIAAVLGDDALAATLAQRAAERGRLFDWDRTAELTWRSIRELAGR